MTESTFRLAIVALGIGLLAVLAWSNRYEMQVDTGVTILDRWSGTIEYMNAPNVWQTYALPEG